MKISSKNISKIWLKLARLYSFSEIFIGRYKFQDI